MRLRNAIAAATLLTPLLFMGMQQPAAAAARHTVVVSGLLRVLSYLDAIADKPIDRTVTLTHSAPTKTIGFVRCAGDEARGELRIKLSLTPSDTVTYTATLKLYEESVCDNTDFEGQKSTTKTVNVGSKARSVLVVDSRELLSKDRTWASFTVSNRAVPPVAPSGVAAFRIQGHKVFVTWIDNDKGETGYEVRHNSIGGSIKSLPANTENYTWDIFVPNRKFCYQVRAVGPGGPSAWSPAGPFEACDAGI